MTTRQLICRIKEQKDKAERALNLLTSINSIPNKLEDIDSEALLFSLLECAPIQTKSATIKKFLLKKLKGETISKEKECGNICIKNLKYEVRITEDDNINLRQLRPWHTPDSLLIICVNKKRVYNIDWKIVKKMVEKSGTYCHGTTAANSKNQNIEYSLTFPYDSLSLYRDKNFEEALFGKTEY